MFRSDWSIKPNGQAFRRLVHEVWRTHAAGRTDDDGRFATRAFYGQLRGHGDLARPDARRRRRPRQRGDRPTVVRVEF